MSRDLEHTRFYDNIREFLNEEEALRKLANGNL